MIPSNRSKIVCIIIIMSIIIKNTKLQTITEKGNKNGNNS